MKSYNLVLDILSKNNFPSVLFEFLLLLEEFSEWSSVPDWNLLLRAIKSSFEGGACFSAMVRASKAGSLSFKDSRLVTLSVSSFLMLKIFTIITGMYSNFFLTVIIFTSQSFVHWLYFLVTICSPTFVVGASRFIRNSNQWLQAVCILCKLCNCNTSMITKILLYTVTLLFLFHNLHCRISLNKSRFKFWTFFLSLLSTKCSRIPIW